MTIIESKGNRFPKELCRACVYLKRSLVVYIGKEKKFLSFCSKSLIRFFFYYNFNLSHFKLPSRENKII